MPARTAARAAALSSHAVSFAPSLWRLHPGLREQPVFTQLAAVTGLGKRQQELSGQRQRAAVGLEVRPPLDGHAPAVHDGPAVAQFDARLRGGDRAPVVAN